VFFFSTNFCWNFHCNFCRTRHAATSNRAKSSRFQSDLSQGDFKHVFFSRNSHCNFCRTQLQIVRKLADFSATCQRVSIGIEFPLHYCLNHCITYISCSLKLSRCLCVCYIFVTQSVLVKMRDGSPGLDCVILVTFL